MALKPSALDEDRPKTAAMASPDCPYIRARTPKKNDRPEYS